MPGTAGAIPYRLREQPAGSDHLHVFFPRLQPGGARPNSFLSSRLLDLDAHQLMLGSCPYGFVGPERRLIGRDAAVSLIRRTCERLNVAPEAATALGTSMGGIMALLIGLPAGVGRIIAGGAPIDMGKTLMRFDRLDGPSFAAKAAAASFIALADNGDGRAVAWLNKAILTEARTVARPVRIDLFGSESDRTLKAMTSFARTFAEHDRVDVRLTVDSYAAHREIHEPFVRFVRELLVNEG